MELVFVFIYEFFCYWKVKVVFGFGLWDGLEV